MSLSRGEMRSGSGLVLAVTAITLGAACQYGVRDGTGSLSGGSPSLDGGDAAGGSASDDGSSSGPAMGDEGCNGALTAEIGRADVSILLLIDRSGSMNNDLGRTIPSISRWEAVEDALLGEDGVVNELQDEVRFGMSLYSARDYEVSSCPELTEVAPDYNNREDMADAFVNPLTQGTTPTGAALRSVARAFAQQDDGTAKAILLATDGEPNTCRDDTPGSAAGQEEAIEAAQEAFALGIRTFVLSVGNEVSESHLQAMANAGAGQPADNQRRARFFQANSASSLSTTFHRIIDEFVPCDYAINGIVDLEEACSGTVELDGDDLECGEDWEISSESTLTLLGEACDTLQDGDDHDIDARFPCGVINTL